MSEEFETLDKKEYRAVTLDMAKKVLPLLVLSIGVLIMLLQWIIGLNIVILIGAIYMMICAVLITLGVTVKRKLYLWFLVGYIAVNFGIATFCIFNGADAGWGALIDNGHTGFITSLHPLWQGEGNFWTRLAGNIIICGPTFLLILAMFLIVLKAKWAGKLKTAITSTISVILIGMSVFFVFTVNLRNNPKVFDMSKGHDEYLNNVNKVSSDSPNVLIILMDDLGYGDTSYNARKAGMTPAYETPNIDSIAENGIDFDNFYSSYSVCSPARFSLMTGRYPYRGYVDNVMYPTVNTFAPFAATRVYNSIELGANADGMLGDEVTIAETFKAAGYNTGAFGKWHLGDYGQYLPTNQGFDYFYGSHHVNDMTPFYHATETDGSYEIVKGTDSLDQSDATKLIHDEISSWLDAQINDDNPFFAYYASPWPHAPVYAGYDFQGTTGSGIYADCVTEFDYYLGELFTMLKDRGVFDDTIIVFTSDNGPALQGSTNELRGGKYSAYNAGQKLPFYIQWNNGWGADGLQGGRTIEQIATLVDLYPTLVEACGITGKVGDNLAKAVYMPSDVDREIDGLSMMPLINDTTNTAFIHDKDHPILHMKREKVQAIQYTVTKEHVLESVTGYVASSTHASQIGNEADYAEMSFIKNNDLLTWKYIKQYKNDNPEFFDKTRKNWFMCLTDDTSESYQRADVFPDLCKEYADTLEQVKQNLKDNRRAIKYDYYNK